MQEVAALTVVDTYIRERLCSMRQQEEDCEVILSQVLIIKNVFAVSRIISSLVFISVNCTISKSLINNQTITWNIGSNCLCKL